MISEKCEQKCADRLGPFEGQPVRAFFDPPA